MRPRQSGVGKSHIAQAIGHRACVAGFQVIYVPAHRMLKELRASRADGSHERRLARYASADLLIIDDLGLRSLAGEEPVDLYDIIRERDEQASTMITLNRALEAWAPLFGDPLLATAAMDRLLHHSHVIDITGASYRNPPRGREKKTD